MSATGNRLPAYYIYAGAAHYAGWHKEENGIDPDTVFAYTDNGWTKNYIGLEWLQNHSLLFRTHPESPPPRDLRLFAIVPTSPFSYLVLTAAAQAPPP